MQFVTKSHWKQTRTTNQQKLTSTKKTPNHQTTLITSANTFWRDALTSLIPIYSSPVPHVNWCFGYICTARYSSHIWLLSASPGLSFSQQDHKAIDMVHYEQSWPNISGLSRINLFSLLISQHPNLKIRILSLPNLKQTLKTCLQFKTHLKKKLLFNTL